MFTDVHVVHKSQIAILRDQSGVRKLGLGIFEERLLVGVGRSCVKIKVAFLDILARVVTLAIGQAEQALFEDEILAIPKNGSETGAALAVAPSEEAIFARPINATSRVIVRKMVPGGAVRGVVFAHRAPLRFRQVGPPPLPVPLTATILRQAD
jgi:hypothetical protein